MFENYGRYWMAMFFFLLIENKTIIFVYEIFACRSARAITQTVLFIITISLFKDNSFLASCQRAAIYDNSLNANTQIMRFD